MYRTVSSGHKSTILMSEKRRKTYGHTKFKLLVRVKNYLYKIFFINELLYSFDRVIGVVFLVSLSFILPFLW